METANTHNSVGRNPVLDALFSYICTESTNTPFPIKGLIPRSFHEQEPNLIGY